MALPDHYLELIKRSLLNELHVELEAILHYFLLRRRDQAAIEPAVVRDIARLRPDIVADIRGARHKGTAVRWPGKPGEAAYEPRDLAEHVHTTIGRERLDQLHRCLDEIARDKIPGDVIEAGAWRGGTAIFMRAYLLAHELNDRIVWVADSFQGAPPPGCAEDADYDVSAARQPITAIDRDRVAALFERYGLLDGRVRFLAGWFRDTLTDPSIERLALLRLDGELYESTMDALVALYDRVSPGGIVFVDDYSARPPCRRAVTDFRGERGIDAPLEPIGQGGVMWRKSTESASLRRRAAPARSTARVRPFVVAAEPPPPDSHFYHSVTLPSGEVRGEWDLRPRTDAYLGGVAFADRSVLEIGPASGYLSFHMEAAGARVTCIEPTMDRLWDVVPLAGFDIDAWRGDFAQRIAGVRRAFWYLHRLYGSAVQVVEAEPYDLPDQLGRFDIGVVTSVLLHCRDPFSLLENAGRHVTDRMIVTEVHYGSLGTDALCRFVPHGRLRQLDTWWQFTPLYFTAALEVLGFPHGTVTHHEQWSEALGANVPMYTVVGRR